MFKNRKMLFLKKTLIFFILMLTFCKEATCQKKITEFKSSFDTIYIEKKDLVIQSNYKKDVYKDIIPEGISISTSLKAFKNNVFYLMYEYNASSDKMQYIYKFYCNKNISLVYKEVVYLRKGNTEGFRLYPKNYDLKHLTLDKMESIGEKINSSIKNKIPIYDGQEKIAYLEYGTYGYDYFINIEDYLENNRVKKIDIINVEKLNNLAFQLYGYSAFKDSIFLLQQILQKFPSRVVAYLNLADSYWAIENQELAKENYKKYIDLMKSQKKDLSKIPKYALERIK